MPTVLRVDGFAVRIYTADHEPMHVHVIGADGEAVVAIGTPARLIRMTGLSNKAVRAAIELVEGHAGMLVNAWEAIHGE